MKRKDNIFKNLMMPKFATSRFDLSHDVKLSFQMGELIPTCVMEVLPGDKVSINVQNLLRFAPLISPVMHRVEVTTHYYFVPNRILWPEWEQWITGDSDVQAPYVTVGEGLGVQIPVGCLADYMGIPTGTYEEQAIHVSPLAIAAYVKIWDEYYRDQNLQDTMFIPLVPGNNDTAYQPLFANDPLRRAWMHDYFTSALPFAQKGDSVQLPLVDQGTIPVEVANNTNTIHVRDAGSGHGDINSQDIRTDGASRLGAGVAGATSVQIDPNGTLEVDIQEDAVTINTLRRALRLQEWLEKNARGGTRYIESILAHFGVKSSDARLQRPEYIGGSKQNMVISEVLATAQNSDDNVAVGQMAGHGISAGGSGTFSYRAEEHGWIIGIVNVQPVTAYQQGLHRSFSRFDRLDYGWPTFANIGEQEIKNKELIADLPVSTDPDGTFGYTPRYSEYKFMNSRVAGEMRDTLAFWHLGRIFTGTPLLNEDFISCVPSDRIFAVTDPGSDHVYAHIFNNVTAVRKLPRYGIPTI